MCLSTAPSMWEKTVLQSCWHWVQRWGSSDLLCSRFKEKQDFPFKDQRKSHRYELCTTFRPPALAAMTPKAAAQLLIQTKQYSWLRFPRSGNKRGHVRCANARSTASPASADTDQQGKHKRPLNGEPTHLFPPSKGLVSAWRCGLSPLVFLRQLLCWRAVSGCQCRVHFLFPNMINDHIKQPYDRRSVCKCLDLAAKRLLWSRCGQSSESVSTVEGLPL